ncbi:hypothetical protein PF005_g4478 [Phytophthora fragariae]|uniref:Ankyrin repeat-containing domain n=1 Tax=Phytophthora fragariae TaxID=53985 RepID=A0A6A3F844_9STRA|nr:hypothetical protein PF003_g12312 [Phytophthora fragariae]KAE8942144.1 hypothetical protein PF009_g8068 [Phytophthora fragariae]KAE9018893.1 hypothetical protein PF011_g6074 [Phytophthora fragariae]KAE9122102.1 hypothetical protein PF007_g7585 [Phytophthora fragariae]KAE9123205.1 hypothetical protein PF010_g6498 [Phytophthora fragariae]
METPLLLRVKLALSPDFEAFPHVIQYVSDLLLPRTIDGAIYNDLHRIKKVYEPFLPRTVGAMDGAAARGRLDILQSLQSAHREGCSSAAFVGAAAHAHLDVIWWLNEFYESLARPAEMVNAAARNGHVQVVEFLWRKLNREELVSALEVATASGHRNVAELLRVKLIDD